MLDKPSTTLREYRNKYQNLITGVSTFEDTASALGDPISRESFSKYRYSGDIEIVFKNKVIMTVIIKDSNYTDVNGISIGADKGDIDSLEGIEKRQFKTSTMNLTNGSIYWYDAENKVNRIVLIADTKFK
ncbi:hypothetical protein AB833_12005 [Chromatiales bacterium (ex Bugula neritina AB1)]|nr:hypothetical protein AB833_12005 [Chromatiales bacterium (ex Bugula neritina AB1)]